MAFNDEKMNIYGGIVTRPPGSSTFSTFYQWRFLIYRYSIMATARCIPAWQDPDEVISPIP